MPLIVKVDASGNVSAINLDNAKHASVSLTDAPAGDPSSRQRMQTITDMVYVNGNIGMRCRGCMLQESFGNHEVHWSSSFDLSS